MVRVLGGLVLGLVLVCALFAAAMTWQAERALARLDALMGPAEMRQSLPPAPLTGAESVALFATAQILPLRQPGAASVAPGRVFRDCADCPEMVEIPAGYFLQGSPLFEDGRYGHVKSRRPYMRQLKFANREGPRRLVRIPEPIAVTRTELTLADWQAAQADPDWERITGRAPHLLDLGPAAAPDLPATRIDWFDAQAYAAWLSHKTGETYRLPSDAEWEYAARAGTVTRFPWGDAVGLEHAACFGCSEVWSARAHVPVASFPPNGFGLYDMIGNGMEWIEDCFEPWHLSDPADGSAFAYPDCEFRTLRGGSALDPAWQARSAFRVGPHPYNNGEGSVIRLVREIGDELSPQIADADGG